MSYRKTVQYLLLAFVAASVIYLVAKQGRSSDSELPASLTTEAASAPAPAESSAPSTQSSAAPAAERKDPQPAAVAPKLDPRPPQSAQKILVYYFFTTVRCPSCRYIEATTQQALMGNFADALANGSVEWRPVNVQLPQNRHYIRDYQLFTKSVVIARVKDGQQVEWKNLERVWELVGNTEAFHRYIRDEIRAYQRKS